MKCRTAGIAASAMVTAIGALTGEAALAEDRSEGLQEIVVTAQRRSQSVQDVAISMAAFGEQQMKDLGLNNVADLAKNIPNVNFASFFGVGKPNISIRGISIGNLFTNFEQAPVGVYYDEIYIGSRSGQMAQIFDQERIEVLRGPQGTLFGRNTTAGAVNFVSKKPGDHFEADASVGYGRFNELNLEAGVTLPVSDTLSFRFAGVKRTRDGWQTNVNPQALPGQRELDDIDNWGVRGLAQWKPSENVTWLLNLHAGGNDTNTPVIHADLGSNGTNEPNIFTGYQETGRWDTVSANDPFKEKLKARGASLTGNLKFGDFTLTSISSYEWTDYFEADDDDGTPYRITPINERDITTQYSQEFRLAAKQGRFDWVAGVYYYHDKIRQTYNTEAFTDPIFAGQGFAAIIQNTPLQTSKNFAVFGDLRISLAERLTLNLGARFTHEKKHFEGNATLNLPDFNTGTFQTIGGPSDPDSVRDPSWSAPTGRVALEWKPDDNSLIYTSFSRGFKSGGINGLAFSSSSELTPYDPEKVNAFEVGAKTEWLEGKLIANAAVFYNKLKDYQALVVDVSNGPPLFFVRNAADGTSKGAEFTIEARPDRHWYTSAGIGYVKTEYQNFLLPDGTDFSGREFTNAPKITANALVQYSLPLAGGTLSPHVDASYTSHQWFDTNQRAGIDEMGGYTLLNASIPWRSGDDKWSVSLWGRNLGNKHYLLQTIGNGFASYGAAVSYHAAPRTYGVTIGYSFN